MTPPAAILPPVSLTALVGAGGKTSLMTCLAKVWAAAGHQTGAVLMTTTTRLFLPADETALWLPPASTDAATLIAGVRDRLVPGVPLLVAHPPPAGTKTEPHAMPPKLVGLPAGHIDALCHALPHVAVLVEADGAARRPLKAPAAHEPVIPASATRVMGIMGLDVLGHPLDGDHVHRPERLQALLDVPSGSRITPAMLARVAVAEEGLFKGAPQQAERWLVLNKADDEAARNAARLVARLVSEAGFACGLLIGSARSNRWERFSTVSCLQPARPVPGFDWPVR